MTKFVSAALVFLGASVVHAEDTRQLDAHEHGVGQLNIAIDATQIAIELHAPGADIVGFEYAAQSSEDCATVDDAVARLARPLDLFGFPEAAACGVVEARASLETEEGHDDHDHAEHKEEEHDHAAHKDEGHDHAEHKHDDPDHGHEHADHAQETGHSEFHAEYLLTCADPAQATLITFAYFDAFPNARELEVQVITDRGATAAEVTKDAPVLDLRELF
jgi:hypothetical protein